nr:MAG TPA: hypothetical protein [Caudoviricetes sp.]
MVLLVVLLNKHHLKPLPHKGSSIPPSPPVSEQGSGLSSEPCFFHEKDESKARKNPCGPKSHHERFAGTKPSSPHRDLRRTRISS